MRKVGYILTLILLLTACSVSRKQKSEKFELKEASGKALLLKSIENQNITSRSFFIEKAQFKIKSGDSENSGIATIKFLTPDKFLISVKSIAGIEIARICLTGDSILANDRFNKKFYYGSTSFLKNKYGLTTKVLAVVFGDYVNEDKIDSTTINCIDGKVQIPGSVKDLKIKYLIDCISGKSVLTVPDDNLKESKLQIEYSDFFMIDDINTPGRIEISDIEHNTIIEIKIQRIIIPWEGSIEFIPGKQYEKINLL